MKHLLHIILTIHMAVLFSMGVKTQDTLALYPEQDNSMFQVPNRYSNAIGPELYTGTVNNGSLLARRALIQFSFSDIPKTATIIGVQLELYCTKASSSGNTSTYDLHRLEESWGEESSYSPNGQGVLADTGDVTWKDRFYDFDNPIEWLAQGGTFNNIPSASIPVNLIDTLYIWTGGQLIEDVQDMLLNPGENFGWILKASDESIGGLGRGFASREHEQNEFRPRLTVSYTIQTSTDEFSQEDAWKVYPNPAENYLIVEAIGDNLIHSYQIVDLFGRIICEGDLNTSITRINTSSFQSGNYFIRFPGSENKVIRWIKK